MRTEYEWDEQAGRCVRRTKPRIFPQEVVDYFNRPENDFSDCPQMTGEANGPAFRGRNLFRCLQANALTEESLGRKMTLEEFVTASADGTLGPIKLPPAKPLEFEFAPRNQVEQYEAIADDFMRRIFGMEPEDYMMSDESALSDFKSVNDLDTVEAIKNRVLECYGFLPLSPYFVDIFTVIESRGRI